MKIYSKTDVGKVRNCNQDSYYVEKLTDENVLIVVCDGMGGANAGNVASEMAVNEITEYVKKSYRDNMDSETILKMLKNAVTCSNIMIYDKSLKSPALNGMGTTAVAAIVTNKEAFIVHVGDSRAYLIGDELKQITRDHSVVQSLIETGKITQEEAKYHPRKNIITRALGVEEEVIPDCNHVLVETGNTLLICTDGLTNYIESHEILKIVKMSNTADIAELLINEANKNGGGDNITVVAITM